MHFTKKKSNKINAAHDKCEKNIRNFFEVCLRKRLEGYIFTQYHGCLKLN